MDAFAEVFSFAVARCGVCCWRKCAVGLLLWLHALLPARWAGHKCPVASKETWISLVHDPTWSNMDSSLLFVSTFSPNPRRLAHFFCLPCFQEKLQQMTKILSLFQTSSIVIVHNQFVSGLLILHIRRTTWYLHVWLKSLCVWRFWSQPQDLCVHLNNLRIQDKIAAMSRGRRVASWRESNSWNFLAGWSSSLPCF